MLSFYRGIYKLLGCLLELLLGSLVVARHTYLILYLDMNGLPRILLALSRLVTCATIHSVVHHASIKRIWRLILLLSLVASDNGPSNYSQSTRILRLSLLLELRAPLHWATHCDVPGRILFQLLSLWDIGVLRKSTSKLTLIAIYWLTIVFLFIILLLLLDNVTRSHL
jgi:hypothetical protein